MVGLVNQGATCYLNALLKVLYNIGSFRSAIFQHQSESQIMTALQKLFGLLSLSSRYAVGTTELTSAFGWSGAEVFDQHDALELFSVLLESVEKESGGAGAGGDVFSKLFRGALTDSIKCPSCQFVSDTEAAYLDIPLHLPEGGASGRHELFDLIKAYSADECLSADNAVECSKCKERVQATKSVSIKTIPQVLIFNLKRIGFDAATSRRKKLTAPVLFPQSLQASELASADGADSKYTLTSVILHNGSATGGHYRAMIRDSQSGAWYEHNDADVRKVSEADEARLFWYRSKGVTEPSPTSTALPSPTDDTQSSGRDEAGRGSNDTLYEGAYVLVYQREDVLAEQAEAKGSALPPPVMAFIEADNEEIGKLQKAYEIYNRQTSLHVTVIGSDSGAGELSAVSSVELPADTPLSEALASVYAAVSAAKAAAGASALPDLSLGRLRRYERSCHRLGETFGGRDAESLAALSLGMDPLLSGDFVRVPEGCSVALEFRKPDDEFVEFSGKEMQLRIARWTLDASGDLVESEACVAVVPGEDASTVAGLRAAAVSGLSLGGAAGEEGVAARVVLMKDSDRGPVVLLDDAKTLKGDCRLYSGGEVLVELLPPGTTRSLPQEEAGGGDVSPVLAALLSRRQSIEVMYNAPAPAGAVPEYRLKMALSSALTLAEFKERVLRAGHWEGVGAFHVRRSATGAQIKSEGKSLDELGITNQSVIHLQVCYVISYHSIA
jgi:hypothetical protein